ncbi:MAG: MIP family channel protein [Oscillospiraceae bacterium]|nr:MIP family channel protein [Oscillospiraceae bacterium]MBQ9938157.1 MIP family channel protein [Oscillospiraceae bacterium]
MKLVKKAIAEFIGTLVLVLVACGVAAVSGCAFPEAGYVATALAFGLVIVAMAYSIGNISGCHINPAVSIAMLVSKKMSVKEFFAYIAAQFLGAIAGAGILAYFMGSTEALGQNGLYDGDIVKSLIVEVVLTFIFVLAILGVTSKKENSNVAGLVIGLSLVLVHLLGIPFTGTSVNPARSFGPALLVGGDALANVWVFIVAPLVGGVLAAIVYKYLDCKKAK